MRYTKEQLLEHHEKIAKIVFPAINDRTAAYNKQMKERFDGKKIIKERFPDGTMVMIRESKRLGAMQAKYSGPFKVL